MFRLLNRMAVAAAILSFSGAAHANLIANGSFEDSVVTAGDVCGPYPYCRAFMPGDTIDGWIVVGKGGAAGTAMVISNNYTEPDNGDGLTLHFDPAAGNQSIDLTGEGNQGTTNGIKQTVTTIPGRTYALTFDLGHQYDLAPGYSGAAMVSLWLDLTGSGANEIGVYTNAANTPEDVTWEGFGYDFTAVGDLTTIAFLNATPVGNNFAGLDAVDLVEVLPEPASCGVFATGILILSFALGRYRAQSARIVGSA